MAVVTVLKNVKLAQNLFRCSSHIALSNDYYKIINGFYLNIASLHSCSTSSDLDKVQISDPHNAISNIEIKSDDSITSADLSSLNKISESHVLEPIQEDVSDICAFTSPSFNLAAYVNQSKTLQELVKMGVDLHRIDLRKGAAECILKLDFEKHIKHHLIFLHDYGLPADLFGYFITLNPFIFEQQLEDLQIRINYLEAKKFIPSEISRIITKNPSWLNYSTIEIDKRLGFFQRTFVLSGIEVRKVANTRPSLITYDLAKISTSLFTVKEDMGFNEREAKALLLTRPKLYHMDPKYLQSRFDYVHNVMEISHKQIVKQPGILLFRIYIVKERHEFLKELGKAQYNPRLPGYVSLDTLVLCNDVDFCKNVAKTSIDVFNKFLKTR